MWIAIALLIGYIIYRFCRALFKPIIDFVYQTALNVLEGIGMSEQAAKAFISLVIILLILAAIFG